MNGTRCIDDADIAPAYARADTAISPHRRTLRGAAIVSTVVCTTLATLFLSTRAEESPGADMPAKAPPATPHTATACTHSVSSGEIPVDGTVSAGGLSFTQSVAPTWRAKPEHRVPNSIDAVTLADTVSDMGASNWIGQLTVGITNFAPSMPLAAQANLMLKCVLGSPLYEGTTPVVGTVDTRPGTLDGVPITTLEVPISVTVADPTIRGDDVVIVIVGTRPSTYFLSTVPFGDGVRQAVARAAHAGLQVFSG